MMLAYTWNTPATFPSLPSGTLNGSREAQPPAIRESSRDGLPIPVLVGVDRLSGFKRVVRQVNPSKAAALRRVGRMEWAYPLAPHTLRLIFHPPIQRYINSGLLSLIFGTR